MAKDHIVQTGAAILRQKAAPLATKDLHSRRTAALLKKMSAALAKEPYGVALAAPQVGEPLRIFVIAGRVFKKNKEEPKDPPDMVFINPKLVKKSRGKKEVSEGCLSVRGKYGSVLRHEKASVRALDARGAPFIYHGSGLLSQIFQHELDHLEGVLYTDKAVTLQDEQKEN